MRKMVWVDLMEVRLGMPIVRFVWRFAMSVSLLEIFEALWV